MANRLRTDVFRPEECPQGHRGHIWLHGRYSDWSPAHQKVQYRCAPKGGRRHKFTIMLPPRQPTEHNPVSGQACEHCERGYREGEGPACGHQFMFTLREQAKGIVHVGQGFSLREASKEVRLAALRPKQAPRKRLRSKRKLKAPRRRTAVRTSREANIVADSIDLFAPVILRELRTAGDLPIEWPRSVAIDSFSLKVRRWVDGEAVSGGREAGEIFLAMGTDTPNGEPRPLTVGLPGGKDHESAMDFFATLRGAPEWVVTDGDAALEKAIGIAFSKAIRYHCEAHLRNLARDAYKLDRLYKLEDAGPAIAAAIDRAQHTPARFDQLKALVGQLAADAGTALKAWITAYEPLVMSQIALRATHRGMTRSVGAVESELAWIDDQVRKRHGAWRNLARVNSVLALMIAHRAGVAHETRYLHFIRRHLEANGGATGLVKAADYKRFRDRVGASSLRALVTFADQRTIATSTGAANARSGARRQKKIRASRRSRRWTTTARIPRCGCAATGARPRST